MFKVYGFLNNGTRILGTLDVKHLFPTLNVSHLFPTLNVSHLKNEHLSIFILLLSLLFLYGGYKRLLNVVSGTLEQSSKDIGEKISRDISLWKLISHNFKSHTITDARSICEKDIWDVVKVRYIQKFFNCRSNGDFQPINSMGQTFVSHKFFRVLEFTVAEMCIHMVNKIVKHSQPGNRDEYLQNLYKSRIIQLLKQYQKLYDDSSLMPNSLISIFHRITQNLCFIEDIDIYSCSVIFEQIFKTKFGIEVEDLIECIGSLNIFVSSGVIASKVNIFWHPELDIKLKHLKALNLEIFKF